MKRSTGRSTSRSLIILVLMLALSLIPTSASAAGPTLQTDLSDYEPGDTVTFRGSGFSWGEIVNLQAVGSTNGSQISSQATADIFGNIGGSFTLPLVYEYTYSLTATGSSSGLSGVTSFWDRVASFRLVTPTAPVTLQPTITQQYEAQAKNDKNPPQNVEGVWVKWFATGGTLSTDCSQTLQNGKASTIYTAGSTAGTFTVTAIQMTDPNCGGTEVGRDSQDVTIVASDTTPPVITIATDPSDTVAASGWYNVASSGTDGVKVNVSASDPSGVSNITCIDNGTTQVLNVNANSGSFVLGNGTHSVSCSANDAKNNSGVGAGSTAMPLVYKIDQSAPTISASISPAAAITGWYNSATGAPTISFSCGDTGGSGLASACPTSVTLGNGAGQSSSGGPVFDVAGNPSGIATIAGINVDLVAPTISATINPASPASTGWYNISTGAPTVSFNCSDPGGSGLASCTTSVILGDGMNQSVIGTAVDNAGNSATTIKSGINVDLRAPTVTASIAPAAASTGWYNISTGAPTISYNCSDTGPSGIASCPAAVTLGEGAGQTVAAVTISDKAGNLSAPSVIFSGINVDLHAPTITASIAPAAASTGWYNISTSAPTVSFTCGDTGSSGLAVNVCPVAVTLGEGANQSVSKTVTDIAGNTSAPAGVSSINVDLTAPTIMASISPSAATTGWYNIATGAPTVKFTCTDMGSSGLAAGACPVAVTLGEGVNQSVSKTVTDIAGNTSASASVSGINVDLTNPALNISGAVDGTYGVCAKPSKPTFAPTDNVSGIATKSDNWTVPSNASGVGTYTYTATATDIAGNTVSQTRTYNVIYGAAFGGYLQPISMDGSSRFKLGSTVPVKFQLMCGTTPIANATAWLYVAQGDTIPDPGVDEAISTAASTTGNLFRYDSTAQQYIFNLSTKLGYTNPDGTTISAFTQGTWTLKIKLDDGTWRSVNIQLPK